MLTDNAKDFIFYKNTGSKINKNELIFFNLFLIYRRKKAILFFRLLQSESFATIRVRIRINLKFINTSRIVKSWWRFHYQICGLYSRFRFSSFFIPISIYIPIPVPVLLPFLFLFLLVFLLYSYWYSFSILLPFLFFSNSYSFSIPYLFLFLFHSYSYSFSTPILIHYLFLLLLLSLFLS